MGSTRLPGKTLADIRGRPVLAHVIARVQAIRTIDAVVVAVPDTEEDNVLHRLATSLGAELFAGSERDVLDRYHAAARAFKADVIVRITADCPLLDPAVCESVIETFITSGLDYASNVHPPTFPDGLDTEVLSFAALERAWNEATLPSEREHVTPFVWKNPGLFRLGNVESAVDYSNLRWTLDEPSDLTFVREVYAGLDRMGETGFSMRHVLALLGTGQVHAVNDNIARNRGYDASLHQEREPWTR